MFVNVTNIYNINHCINLVPLIRFDLLWVPDSFCTSPFLSWSLIALGSSCSFSQIVVNISDRGEGPKTKSVKQNWHSVSSSCQTQMCLFHQPSQQPTHYSFKLKERLGRNLPFKWWEKRSVSTRVPGSCATAVSQISNETLPL